jgi:hypothetical protein
LAQPSYKFNLLDSQDGQTEILHAAKIMIWRQKLALTEEKCR